MANTVLGSGKLYFDRLIAGAYQGEVLLAETPALSYTVSSTRATEQTADGPIAELAADVLTGVSREGAFSVKDIAAYNLALHVIGAASTITTTVAAKTGTAINGGVAIPAGGRYYQLGLTDYPHVGVRGITAVSVKTGTTTYVADTDYTLDATLGRIYVPVGSPMISAICTANYSTSATSWSEVASDNSSVGEGRLRFIADNTTGANQDFIFSSVVIMPDGAMDLKSRDKYQTLGFKFSIRKPATGSAMYAVSRPA